MINIILGAILFICVMHIVYEHQTQRWPEGLTNGMLFTNTTIVGIGAFMILFELYKIVAT